jgi:hypothetical protein
LHFLEPTFTRAILHSIQTMMTQTPIKSRQYLSTEFAAEDFTFPHVQAVRGEEDSAHCGYFIPLPQAEKAAWSNIEQAETIVYTYNDGTTAEGILLTKPRMVLSAVSKLGMFDRLASQSEDRLVVLGEWDRNLSQDPNAGNFQIYLVMFFGENNIPLHQIPLKLIAKGAHQATLSKFWEQSCTKISMLHSQAAKVGFFPRHEKYKVLCLFEPIIKRMLVGTGLKSAACCIDGFVAPTADNWQSFFLGECEEVLAQTVLQIFNPQPRTLLSAPSSGSVIALIPPAESTRSVSAVPRQITAVDDEIVSLPRQITEVKDDLIPAVPDSAPVSTTPRSTTRTTARTASVPATVLVETELVDTDLDESDFIDEEDADRIPF